MREHQFVVVADLEERAAVLPERQDDLALRVDDGRVDVFRGDVHEPRDEIGHQLPDGHRAVAVGRKADVAVRWQS